MIDTIIGRLIFLKCRCQRKLHYLLLRFVKTKAQICKKKEQREQANSKVQVKKNLWRYGMGGAFPSLAEGKWNKNIWKSWISKEEQTRKWVWNIRWLRGAGRCRVTAEQVGVAEHHIMWRSHPWWMKGHFDIIEQHFKLI